MKKDKIKLYTFNILGLVMLFSFIWFQYVRTRIPRDIPFNLSLITLIILVITCIIFLFLLKRILKPTTSLNIIIMSKYIQKLNQPLFILDKTMRQTFYIIWSLENISLFLPFINYQKPLILFTLYVFFQYLPKICLLGLFIIDIFYFHRLELLYVFIILGLISLGFTYTIYALRQLHKEYWDYINNTFVICFIPTNKEQLVEYEEEREIDWYYNLKEFLGHRVTKGYGWEKFDYCAQLTHPANMCSANERTIELEKFYLLMPIVIALEDFFFYYDCIFDNDPDKISYKELLLSLKSIKRHHIILILNIIIYLLYFLLWLYILFISLPSFHVSDAEWMFIESFQDTYNPFIDLIMEKW